MATYVKGAYAHLVYCANIKERMNLMVERIGEHVLPKLVPFDDGHCKVCLALTNVKNIRSTHVSSS